MKISRDGPISPILKKCSEQFGWRFFFGKHQEISLRNRSQPLSRTMGFGNRPGKLVGWVVGWSEPPTGWSFCWDGKWDVNSHPSRLNYYKFLNDGIPSKCIFFGGFFWHHVLFPKAKIQGKSQNPPKKYVHYKPSFATVTAVSHPTICHIYHFE